MSTRFSNFIETATAQLDSLCTDEELGRYKGAINRQSDKLSASLQKTQTRKFDRDGLPPDTPRDTPRNVIHTTGTNNKSHRHKKRPPKVPDNSKWVVNLSDASLSNAELSVLSKGLNFCPRPKSFNALLLKEDLDQFSRRLRLRDFFNKLQAEDEDDDSLSSSVTTNNPPDPDTYRFRNKSKWNPPIGRTPALEVFITACESDILSSHPKLSRKDNLTPAERNALRELQSNTAITIKPADKGSATVVLNTPDYIEAAEKQLSDVRYYIQLTTDPTSDFANQLSDTLREMHTLEYIDEKTFEYLNPTEDNLKPGRLYLQPKIHKTGYRPIISANGHFTEKTSEFLDYHMRPHVSILPSYIQDTTDYLTKTPSENLPDGTLLLTMDVVSLYTNIPHDEGIEACRQAWDSRTNPDIPTKYLVKLLTHVLKLNNFVFNGDHYLQTSGTAMGTKMAPSYANIFMGQLEKDLLDKAPHKPFSWLRFIDDIESKWTQGLDTLLEFIQFVNSFHPTIKFTAEYSQHQSVFLDTISTLSNGTVTFDLHSKPTDTHQYLLPSSCHPPHCAKGMAYGQALRIRRICSDIDTFEQRAVELTRHFVSRGHDVDHTLEAVERARNTERNEALRYKTKATPVRVPFVTTYHPDLPQIATILHKHWHFIETNPYLNSLFPEHPVVAFRRPRNLRDILVNATVQHSTPHSQFTTEAVVKCTNKRCLACPRFPTTQITHVTSHVTGQRFVLSGHNLTCKTTNLIYLISCNICGKQYVGETGDSLNKRLNNHRSSIRSKPGSPHYKLPVGKHFRLKNHCVSSFTIVPLDHNSNWDPQQRKRKEKYWIHQMRTMQPFGLNDDF
jgi:hypothetical protein